MSSKSASQAQWETYVEQYHCRAKFTPDGRLLSTEWASRPIFSRRGTEEGIFLPEHPGQYENEALGNLIEQMREEPGRSEDNIRRAINRAKVRAFDLIMSNPDLDAFSTLTCDPERVDRTDYNAVYKYLKVWLSNKVSRRDLRYILCPEYHADGAGIHFHMISNRCALDAVPSLTPSGKVRQRKGKPVYNLPEWKLGFSTAQIIDRDDPREAVAKYIFKYMGKAAGARIGGRYFLHGGRLMEPYYLYADSLDEFPDRETKWTMEFSPCAGMEYAKHYHV